VDVTISISVNERPPELFKVVLSAERTEVYSKQSAGLTVSALFGATPAGGATVKLTASLGSIDKPDGTTDATGKYCATFTAPDVTVSTQVIINLTATKGAQTATHQIRVQVGPKPTKGLHIISLEASPMELASTDATSTIMVFVEYDGAATAGINMALTAEKGTFDPPSGTTDARGYFKSVFSPSKDSSGTIGITVTAQYQTVSDEQSLSVRIKTISSVTIQSPQVNAVVSGKVTVSGAASPGAIQVQFRIGEEDEWHIVSGTTSWNYIWTTTNFANGGYKLYAKSFDGSQYSAIVEQMVTVANVPQLGIITPPAEKNVKGTLELRGSASSFNTKVFYQIDDGQFIEASGTPSDWQISIDTKELKDGQHTIKIKASAGNVDSPLETFPFVTRNHSSAVSAAPDAIMLAIPILVILIVVVAVAIIMVIKRGKRPVVHVP
jgi:hypothetical protein